MNTRSRGVFLTVSAPSVHPKTTTVGHTSASQHRPKHFLQPSATKTPASARKTQVGLRSLTSATQGPTLTSLSHFSHPHIPPHKGKDGGDPFLFISWKERYERRTSLLLYPHTEKLHPSVFPTFVKSLKPTFPRTYLGLAQGFVNLQNEFQCIGSLTREVSNMNAGQ